MWEKYFLALFEKKTFSAPRKAENIKTKQLHQMGVWGCLSYSWGVEVPYMKKFYSLELLKIIFRQKKWLNAHADPPQNWSLPKLRSYALKISQLDHDFVLGSNQSELDKKLFWFWVVRLTDWNKLIIPWKKIWKYKCVTSWNNFGNQIFKLACWDAF